MTRPVVAVPLRIERIALGRMSGVDVVRIGAGWARASRAASGLDRPAVLVLGVCGGLQPGQRPGDLVVATELRGPQGTVVCGRSRLADALGAAGLTVHSGPIHTADHLVDGAERAALARTGALAVDTESAAFAGAVVVRAIADTTERPLRSPATVGGGIAALRSLRRAAPVIARWTTSVPYESEREG